MYFRCISNENLKYEFLDENGNCLLRAWPYSKILSRGWRVYDNDENLVFEMLYSTTIYQLWKNLKAYRVVLFQNGISLYCKKSLDFSVWPPIVKFKIGGLAKDYFFHRQFCQKRKYIVDSYNKDVGEIKSESYGDLTSKFGITFNDNIDVKFIFAIFLIVQPDPYW
jgi:hypothetical protein